MIEFRLPAAAASIVLIAAMTGCGERTEPTSPQERTAATVVLAAKPQRADLCLYQAKANGDFDAAGLDVTLLVPSSPAAPLEMLANGRADIAAARPDQVLASRSGGAPFVSVALLTSTQVDAPVRPTVQPRKPGRGPSSKPKASPAPSVLVSTERFISSDGSTVRRLLQAAGRACAVSPAKLAPGLAALAAADRSAARAPQANPPAGPPVTQPPSGRPWGWQDSVRWTALVSRLRKSGEISSRGAPNTAWTNEFLAGEGS